MGFWSCRLPSGPSMCGGLQLDTFEKHQLRDRLGFAVPSSAEQAFRAAEAYAAASQSKADVASREWWGWHRRWVKGEQRALSSDSSGQVSSADRHSVARLVRLGVPHELRASVWPLLCGADRKAKAARAAAGGGRRGRGWCPLSEAEAGLDRDILGQIEKDVRRTVRRLGALRGGAERGQSSSCR